MRKLLLASAAALIIATPAAARDGSGYFGIEGGVLFPQDMGVEGEFLFDDPLTPDFLEQDIADVEFKTGFDVDLIAGYDFGMFRLEGELAYKRAKADDLDFDQDFLDAIGADVDDDVDIDGKVRVISGMINGLLDFGPDNGINGFVGVGFGRAGVKVLGEKDSAWAGQLLAGVRAPISDNIDVGVKYRYFRTGKLNFREDFEDDLGSGFLSSNERFSSHSLLASLIFNFGAPAAPLPPPPPPMVVEPVAPATQTCPDGSVILATSMCPAPPPPPPPAPVERGERGQ